METEIVWREPIDSWLIAIQLGQLSHSLSASGPCLKRGNQRQNVKKREDFFVMAKKMNLMTLEMEIVTNRPPDAAFCSLQPLLLSSPAVITIIDCVCIKRYTEWLVFVACAVSGATLSFFKSISAAIDPFGCRLTDFGEGDTFHFNLFELFVNELDVFLYHSIAL